MLTEGIGDFLSYQTTFLDSDNTLTTREDTAQIREVFERKKHNTILVLDNEQEIHFPVKKSRTLLKRRDSQDFPIHLETHPQIAELNYLTTKILHIITPLMTTEHVQVPEPLGFTTHKASSQTGLVYRKIDSKGASFSDDGRDNSIIKTARGQLFQLGVDFGLKQAESAGFQNPVAKRQLGFNSHGEIIWTPPASHVLNNIDTAQARSGIENNREILSETDITELLLLLEKYDEAELNIRNSFTLPTRTSFVSEKKTHIEKKKHHRKKKDPVWVLKEAYQEGLINETELNVLLTLIHGVDGSDLKNYATLQATYFGISRLVNAGFFPLLAAAAASESPIFYAALAATFQLVVGASTRVGSTLVLQKLLSTEMKVATAVSVIPVIGEWIAVPAQIAYQFHKENTLITHYTKRALIAKISQTLGALPGIKEGGINSDLEEELWNFFVATQKRIERFLRRKPREQQ